MSHHRFVAASEIRDALFKLADWIYLLNFDGDFEDETKNASFAKLGAGTSVFVETVSDYFPNANTGWDVTNNLARASGEGLGTINGEWCVALIFQPDTNNPTQRIWEAIDSVSAFDVRRIFWVQAGKIGAFDGTTRTTARVIASGNEAMFFMRANGADGTADFFENGIKFATTAFINAAIPGTALRLYGVGDYNLTSPTNPAFGIHRMNGLIDGAVSDETIYQIFRQRSGGKKHDWLERPDLQADCVFHAPLWEKAGTQAIDVSGGEKHGTFVNVILRQPSDSDGSTASIYLAGAGGNFVAAGQAVNVDVQDFTASVRFKADIDIGSFGSALSNAAAGKRLDVRWNPSNNGQIYCQAFDGANNSAFYGLTAGLYGDWHTMVWRWDLTGTKTMSVWIDGILQGSASIDKPWNFGASQAAGFEYGRGYAGNFKGFLELPRLYDVALSDALCLELSL